MQILQDPGRIKAVGEFNAQVTEVHKAFFDYWMTNVLFHWDFWVNVALSILPWLIWMKYRKKASTNRLLFVGFFVIILTSWLDFFGTIYGLWYYTGKILPTIPTYIPWDFCIIPVFIMFLLQIKPEVSVWVKALIFAGVGAFIGEPVFMWLGFYVQKHWSVFYSFPIYYLIYLACHKLSRVKNFEPL
ncbi:MAG: CBO0543 family protein [Solirubrobacterales bacterium]